MVSSDLTGKVRQALLADGADLMGIASMERFAHCPAETHPQRYMPDAMCVISNGVHILDGVCDIWDGDPHTPHKSASPYLCVKNPGVFWARRWGWSKAPAGTATWN